MVQKKFFFLPTTNCKKIEVAELAGVGLSIKSDLDSLHSVRIHLSTQNVRVPVSYELS